MTAKIISIAQAKGGVGQSTICANLSVTLSQSAKVMMIDCDPPQQIFVFRFLLNFSAWWIKASKVSNDQISTEEGASGTITRFDNSIIHLTNEFT